MNEYVLLNHSPRKVYLKAPLDIQDQLYGIQYQDETCLYVTESIERLLIYYLMLTNDRRSFVELIRFYSSTELTLEEIDFIIDKFVSDHQPEPIDAWHMRDIPIIADAEHNLVLPLPYESLEIREADERMLMERLVKNGGCVDGPKSYPMLMDWFHEYSDNYAINFNKKNKGRQYEFLADSFLEQHMLTRDDLLIYDPVRKPGEKPYVYIPTPVKKPGFWDIVFSIFNDYPGISFGILAFILILIGGEIILLDGTGPMLIGFFIILAGMACVGKAITGSEEKNNRR